MPSATPAFRARADELAEDIHRRLTQLTADRPVVDLTDVWRTVVEWSQLPIEGDGLGDDFLGTMVYRWPAGMDDGGGGPPPSPVRDDQLLRS